MNNVLSDFFRSNEEREHLKSVEQLRRKGERFIKIRYNGDRIPQLDSDGVCFNIRIHGLRDTEAYEQTDISTGKVEWKSRPGARALQFRQTASGDIEADIWDDPDGWNKHFIATHPELEVLDEEIRKEIEEEGKKPFKPELSRKEEIERRIASDLKELEIIEREEVDKQSTSKSGRSRPKKEMVNNGIDKSTSDMDSSGDSRMESRRQSKRDSSGI